MNNMDFRVKIVSSIKGFSKFFKRSEDLNLKIAFLKSRIDDDLQTLVVLKKFKNSLNKDISKADKSNTLGFEKGYPMVLNPNTKKDSYSFPKDYTSVKSTKKGKYA